MPCEYHDPDDFTTSRKGFEQMRADLNQLTRMLCEVCREAVTRGHYESTVSAELRAWYQAHLRRDVERAAAEANMAIVRREAKRREVADLERKLAKLKEELT